MQYLHIIDACNSGMASLDTGIETLGAGAWKSSASSLSPTSFTALLTHEIGNLQGSTISAANLLSQIWYNSATALKGPQPIYRPAKGDEPTVIFHRICQASGIPGPRGPSAQVMLKVTIEQDHTLPNTEDFVEWLSTNIPPDLRNIEIKCEWRTTSLAFMVTMPAEVSFYLPEYPAYVREGIYRGAFQCRESSSTLTSTTQAEYGGSATGKHGV